MPQLDPTSFAPQLIWLVISFVVLYALLSVYALPKLGGILEARKQRMADDLAQAARLRDEAEKTLAEYEANLVQARMQSQAIVQQARDAANAKLAQEEAALKTRLADYMQQTEAKLADAHQAALANIHKTAESVVSDIVLAALGTKPAPALVEQAVAAELAARQQSAAPPQDKNQA